jgi:hypothetical protein
MDILCSTTRALRACSLYRYCDDHGTNEFVLHTYTASYDTDIPYHPGGSNERLKRIDLIDPHTSRVRGDSNVNLRTRAPLLCSPSSREIEHTTLDDFSTFPVAYPPFAIYRPNDTCRWTVVMPHAGVPSPEPHISASTAAQEPYTSTELPISIKCRCHAFMRLQMPSMALSTYFGWHHLHTWHSQPNRLQAHRA